QIHERIRVERDAEQALYDRLRQKSLELARRAFPEEELSPDVFVTGEASFLDEPSFAEDVETMRKLFAALAEKDRLLHVLRRSIEGKQIQIFIGAESELSDIADVSMVVAPYAKGERILGALAVIGPTRMDYGTVIPQVDYTARAVSRILAETL
ncbi:MAG TPA: HrcA family transcriptional regulator, partial [Fredinandcohnia sp.]|nr:HrcA family transcriptional regulator [Fredinandcohnia sp.]